MIRCGLASLERKHGKRNLAFLTVTVPNLSWIEMRWVCASWGELARRLMEEIGRELRRHNLDPDYVYVNELQDNRYEVGGFIAPHIHAVFQARMTGTREWAISKEKFRNIWERVLGNFLGRPMSLNAATRIEVIKKCPKRYMSKYMSKGGKVVDAIVEAGLREFLPGAWYGLSNNLRKEIRDGIIEVSRDTAFMIAAHLDEYKAAGLVKWFGRIFAIETDNAWEIEYVAAGEKPQIQGNFRALISVVGEFASREAMMQFVPTS